MLTFSYILPFIVAIILIVFALKKVTPWEIMLLVALSLCVTCCTDSCSRATNCLDTEYYGYHVTKIRHTDEWDEWITKTCTRQIPCGTDSNGNTIYTTEEYDCSYCQNHPERWEYFLQNGWSEYIHKNEFEAIRKRWGTQMHFVEMNRHYYQIDGDAQEYFWDNNKRTAVTSSDKRSYRNVHIASHTVYPIDISEEEALELGLHNYPPIRTNAFGVDEQNPIIGYQLPKKDVEAIQYLNGIYGSTKQIRIFIVFFKNKDKGIALKQQQYWKGGNKNELIICLGTKDGKIDWCYPFSWSDDKLLEIKIRDYFIDHKYINMVSFADWLEPQILQNWKRKEFSKDFEYIKPESTNQQQVGNFILTLVINIFGAFVIIMDEIDYDYMHSDFILYIKCVYETIVRWIQIFVTECKDALNKAWNYIQKVVKR